MATLHFFFPLCLLIALFCRLDRVFYKQNASFCVGHTIVNWSTFPRRPTTTSYAVLKLLSQPFDYLDKGHECFVFLSRDQNWVLKCLRLPRHEDLNESIATLFNVYTLCPEETKVVYAHLSPTHSGQFLQLVDRFKRCHSIPIDQLPFIVQRAGTPFYQAFAKSIDPKALIEKAVAIYSSLYDKGLIDLDPIFDKNFGVASEEPFIMDIGRIKPRPATADKLSSLKKMTVHLKDVLTENYPQHLPFYQNCLQKNCLND